VNSIRQEHPDSVEGNAAPTPERIEDEAIRMFAESRYDDASRLLDEYLNQYGGDIDPFERVKTAQLLFETSSFSDDLAFRQGTTIRWLEAAAGADESAWTPITDPATRADLEALFAGPNDRLELLELVSFAPSSTTISQSAIALIEEFGHVHATDHDLARDAERLLHSLGQPNAAYRVEKSRRAVQPSGKPARKRVEDEDIRLTGLTIAIAGGHPALRRAIHNDLLRAGAKEIRDIPPRWEGSRQGREVVALIGGSDVAVLIGRHISHSTVDQVKRAASLAGIPVLTSLTASASGVRRTIEDHLKSRRLDKPARST
jgi:hypothetical protein